MGSGRLERLAPLLGVVFTVLFAAGFVISGEPPDSDATGEEVLAHYDDMGKILFSVALLLAAALVFMFFAGLLRHRLIRNGLEWLASVVFGGAVVYVVGLGLFASSQFALVEAADANQLAAAETLNVLDNNNFAPAVIGVAVVLLASAWHVLAARSLPIWLGWVALILGILALAGPVGFIAFLLFPLWVLAVSIIMFRRPVTSSTPTTV